MIETFIQLHTNLFYWLHSLSNGSDEFKFWLYFIAEEIDIYIIFLSILFMLVHRHSRKGNRPEMVSHQALKEGLFVTSSILVAWAISYVMKITFMMPRPYIRFVSEVVPLFPYGGFDSFPSGHATLFAALATALYIGHKKVGIIFGITAFFIAITRVIAGVHFPIDILVGWIIGVVTVSVVHYYMVKNKQI